MIANAVVRPSSSREQQNNEVLFSSPEELVSDVRMSIGDGVPVLVFVAVNRGNFPSIEYIASTISDKGQYRTYGVYLKSRPPKNVYHALFHCDESLVDLDAIVSQLPPVHFYLQAHGRWIFLFRRIRELNFGLKIAHEVYDWMESFIGDSRQFIDSGMFDKLQIETIIEDEAYTRQYSDLLIHKDSGSWIEGKLMEAKTSSMQLYPCPPSQWMEAPKRYDRTGGVRLVYAGQVMNNQAPAAVFGDLDYLSLIRELTQQGAELTVFNSVFSTRELCQDLFGDYHREMRNNPRFVFREGIDMPGIIRALHGKYDYGLVLFDFDRDLAVGKSHLRETMASKIFTYLSAGLPVIVSEELNHMAEFVRENGIGIVVGKDERSNLVKMLEDIDPRQFIDNIEVAQKKYAIERFVDRFTEWLNRSGNS